MAVTGAISGPADTLPLRQQPPSPHTVQVGQGEQAVKLCGVLLEPPVAHLAISEQVLHHLERMLHDRTQLGPLPVIGPHLVALWVFRHCAHRTAFARDVRHRQGLPRTDVTGITVQIGFPRPGATPAPATRPRRSKRYPSRCEPGR